uniref:DNA topoisomerase I n=1 Tax=Oncorhynchus mykiss TaxID=8022 RepID=A0A8C7RVY1_ONCMY
MECFCNLSNSSDHKEFSEKKHGEKEKERIKHKDGSTDRHREKDKRKEVRVLIGKLLMGKRKQRRSLRRSGSGEFHSCPPAVLLQTCWEGTLTEWCFVMECSNMDVLCIFVGQSNLCINHFLLTNLHYCTWLDYRWEEERATDGSKWSFLEHKGPVMAAPYEPLPSNVRFFYDGKQMKLSPEAEEVATFFAKMLDHEYTTKDTFQKNFFKDWRKEMASEEKSKITDLKKCNFNEMGEYFKAQSEARKAMTKDDKLKIKVENERLLQEYGFCIMDNHKERIANFRIEPPGLFRGRGDHPKMGMLKRRILRGSWLQVRFLDYFDTWTNIQGAIKYIMLNPSSRIKGEKDWQKYETARNLKKCVERLRNQYREDWKSKEMRIRQRAVALYFIDKLALRAGNEKEEGESADTVGCCSLRVEHINLYPEKDGQDFVVEFDFLGKDSIRYYNKVPVEKRVFKNLQLFMENKQPEDDLFDRLNTSILNKHLQELMDDLTAKVFRTYNASITLQQQLKELTSPDENLPAKILSYNRANRAVAILCNHQRAQPKTFEKSMQNLQTKIDAKKDQLSDAKRDVKSAKADLKVRRDEKFKKAVETKKKAVERLEEQLMKLEVQATDREENKQIALGTSKLNYLDPRISVAW